MAFGTMSLLEIASAAGLALRLGADKMTRVEELLRMVDGKEELVVLELLGRLEAQHPELAPVLALVRAKLAR